QERVRQWRNKDEIRLSMLTQHNISKEEHDKWLRGLSTKNDRKFYVIFIDDVPVGSVYLHNINYAESSSEWGFYIGEDIYRDKGLGKCVIFKLLGIVFDELKLKMLITKLLSHNIGALNIYKNFQFKEFNRSPFNEREEIIYMRFSAEDWKQHKYNIRDAYVYPAQTQSNALFDNVAVLTSEESWFVPYARHFVGILNALGHNAKLFHDHEDLTHNFQIVFILSYFKIVRKKEFLDKHKHNLVVHESDLPKGRGWAPLFWQILEGKNKIDIVLFEAKEGIDEGDIYLKDAIEFQGHELHDAIREKQAHKTMQLCLKFLSKYKSLKPIPQEGEATYYEKRAPKNSQLDIDKTIKEQFNLIRIVNNKEFPAFFDYLGHRYIIKIEKDDLSSDNPENRN
ncbi:MAG: UDP-4-amino-4,6-dideoxy-N-acetyl-beta-L-altrosamine N-acetyltransferase, partial [Candidatus Omnitrophica bacterium]|nr:UDP-4-amino-4,6-dideoxy-N-acetyl-beta-L-altrosamine N-acetyltransferase [Candidatus Omnitrophota bacterium]